MIPNVPTDKKIILFDGVCNLCDASVQYIIRKDSKDQFRFVALQSDLGKQIIVYLGLKPATLDSIVLYEPGVAYFYKSDAILEIASALGGFLSLLSVTKGIPVSIRNSIYDYVAKNRYKWYGKKQSCMMPTPAISSKFL